MRMPLVIDRNKSEARVMGFKSGMMGSSHERPMRFEFRSSDVGAQNAELCEFIQQHYEGNTGIYINYPAEKILIREFILPFVDKKKIKELVPFELESLLPYDIHEMVYDYISYPDLEEEKSRIIAVAAHSGLIHDYIKIFKENRILLRGVYVPTDALYRLAHYVDLEDYFLLFVSTGFTMMAAVKDSSLYFSRVTPVGYDSLLKWLMEKWKKNYTESAQLLSNIAIASIEDADYGFYKKHFQLSRPQSKLLLQTISEFGDELAGEVDKTLQFVCDDENQMPVILVSDTPSQPLIEHLLGGRLPGPIDSFPYEKTPIAAMGREYSLLAGAAYGISGNYSMELMTSQQKKEARFKGNAGFRAPIVAGITGVLLFFGSFLFDYMQQVVFVKQAEARQEETFTRYFSKEPLPEPSVVEQAKLALGKEKQRTEIQRILLNKPKVGKILVHLNEALLSVADFRLSRMDYSNEVLKLTASTDSFESHSSIQKALNEHKGFKKVIPKNTRKMIERDGGTRVLFTLEITPAKEGEN